MTRPLVENFRPDVLILAPGPEHNIPDIPGIYKRKVLTSAKLHNQLKFALKFAGPEILRKLSKIWMPIGKNVVVIGDRLQGLRTAELLVKRSRKMEDLEIARVRPIFRFL